MSEQTCTPIPVDLTRVLAALGGNLPVLEKIIDHLKANGPLQLELLRTGIEEKNHGEVRKAARSLKDSLANFGIGKAVRLSFLLEQEGKAQNLISAPLLFAELHHEVETILTYFEGENWKKDWL